MVTAGSTLPLRAHQRGFTYLWLLFILAAGAGGLAGIGQRTSAAVQRDREAELMFRGHEIVRAISAYRAATPGAAKTFPASLQDLLDDRRGPRRLRHLRRLYADPFTGKPDWVLITSKDGHISGVRSRASVVAMRVADLPPPAAGKQWLIRDRVFVDSEGAEPSASLAAPSAKPDDRRGEKAPRKLAKDSFE